MTSRKISRDYVPKIEVRLEALRLFLDRERFDDVVREAHECIELIVKGALRFIGVDPPRRHDPAPILRLHRERLPPAWQAALDDIERVSEDLAQDRGLAFYGDEDDLVPPSELFERADAESAIAAVERLLGLYRTLVALP